MSQQGTNTLAAIIKASVALMIIAMTIFYLPSVIGAPNQTILAGVDIVRNPEVKATNHKKTDYKKKPKRASALQKKSYNQSKRKFGHSSDRIKVSGYRGKTFVYGEVIARQDGKVEGFIYHPDNSKTYVYGKKIKDTINLYDSSGNLYQMLH